jgi:hypothetical protein
MIHGAAEVGAEVAFIATRVPPALEPSPAAVARADAVSTMDSASGSERQSSISIGSAASVAGNLLSGVFKKLTPAEKEAERKLEEAPSEDAAAAWAAAVAEEAAGGAAAAEPAGEPSTPATEAAASDRRISADYVKVGVMGVGSGVMGKLGAMGKRFGTSSGKSRDRADSTGSAPDAAGALAAAEALAAANPFTKLGGRKSPANPFDADAAAAAPASSRRSPRRRSTLTPRASSSTPSIKGGPVTRRRSRLPTSPSPSGPQPMRRRRRRESARGRCWRREGSRFRVQFSRV